jgi:hypothetical protein
MRLTWRLWIQRFSTKAGHTDERILWPRFAGKRESERRRIERAKKKLAKRLFY